MRLYGYCTVQKCDFSIYVKEIPASTHDDPNAVIYGRINCKYASYGGDCDGNCSILKQHGIKQG